MSEAQNYRIGEFTLRRSPLRLLSERPLLKPLPAAAPGILLALLDRRGELVSGETLKKAGWPGAHSVEDNSLEKVISALRSNLGSDAIRNDRRGNYQYIGEFLPVDELLEPALENRQRSGDIDCSLAGRDPQFVGRAKVIEDVEAHLAREASGYLVLIGGMGTGKSALVSELIHRQKASGEEPVYHIVKYQPSASGEPRNIAACLCARLLSKHRYRQPDGWERLQPEERLERLLQLLSEQVLRDGRKEVLYLDAADQAEASLRRPLLPGTLRELPKGILCVITSRAHQEWLGTINSVKVWNFAELTDDRSDVCQYLRNAGGQSMLTPSENLIGEISGRLERPVFFTVVARLRQLEDPNLPRQLRQDLLTKAELWSAPPEDLVHSEAMRVVSGAAVIGISEDNVWKTLGLLAITPEALAEEQFTDLGLWNMGVSDAVLKLAVNFFAKRPALRAPSVEYVFDHPGYQREILAHLSRLDLTQIHGLFSEKCAQGWSSAGRTSQSYAVRFLPFHLRAAQRWNQLCDLLLNVAYLETRLAAENPATSEQGDKGHDDGPRIRNTATQIFDLIHDFHETLHLLPPEHPRRPEVEAVKEALDRESPVLQEDPALLLQQLHNRLIWRWDNTTALGSELRTATSRSRRPWLRMLTPPPEGVATPLIRTFRGHSGIIHRVVFSPDDQVLASGGDDKIVRLWEVQTGRLKYALDGHKGGVWQLAFSPDGRLLASGCSLDGEVRIWDTRRGSLQLIIKGCYGLRCVCFSADGKRVLTGSVNDVHIWDSGTGEHLDSTPSGIGDVRAISPSEKVVTSRSGGTDIWDLPTGTSVRIENYINPFAAFPPAGDLLATSASYRSVEIWDLGAKVRKYSLQIEHAEPSLLPFLNFKHRGCLALNEHWVAFGSCDRSISLWNMETGAPIGILPGHYASATSSPPAVALPREGRQVASGGADALVKLWNFPSAESPSAAEMRLGGIYSIAFSPSGERVAAGFQDGAARTRSRRKEQPRQSFGEHRYGVRSVAFPSEDTLVTAGGDGKICYWQVDTGKQICAFEFDGDIDCVRCSNDGQMLAFGGIKGIIGLASRSGFRLIEQARQENVRSLAFSGDGALLASGHGNGTVRIYDIASSTVRLERSLHSTWVHALAFDGSGHNLASGGFDNTFKLSEVQSGKEIWSAQFESAVMSAAFSDDGRLLACGTYGSGTRVFETTTGAPVLWAPAEGTVLALRWEEGGSRLAVADTGGEFPGPIVSCFEITS